MKFSNVLSLVALLSSAHNAAADGHMPCLGACSTTGGEKECTFTVKLDLHAGELGYFHFEECTGTNPTLGIEKGVTYKFVQEDITNYYHPMGLAYYPDGAHAGVDELEPGIAPPGSTSNCAEDMSCPAPMYIKNGIYLGTYSNNAMIAPISSDEDDFGLDVYEPEFFLDPVTWASAGTYEIALKFDVDDFTDDIFYFCHIHQYMTGRMKFVDSEGNELSPVDNPPIEYEYDVPSAYDQGCGTHGLGNFQLPHAQCPEQFVCNKPDGASGAFAGCLDSMNCAMTVGMTTNVNQGSAIALFNHQMIPHHQNAVNMCKALMASGELVCDDITDEDDAHCIMSVLCYEIINGQNFQIQTMRGVLDGLGYDATDDCEVEVSGPFHSKSSKSSKTSKKSKKAKKGLRQ